MSLFHLFQDAGPLAYLLLLLFPPSLVLCWALGLVGLGRLRVPSGALLVGPVALVLAGALGTWQGLGYAAEAVAHASPDIRPILALAGISIASYTLILGLGAAVTVLVLGIPAFGLGRGARGGAEARWTLVHAVAPLIIGATGALGVAMAGSLAGAAVIGSTALGVALASLRLDAEGPDAERQAAGRLSVAALGAYASLLLWWGAHEAQRSQVFDALAHAPADKKAELAAMAANAYILWPYLATLALTVICGLVVVAPVAPFLAVRRSAIHAMVFGVVGVVPLVTGVAVELRRAALTEETISWSEKRATVLGERGVALPSTSVSREPQLQVTLTLHGDRLWVDDEEVAVGDAREVVQPVFERLDYYATVQRQLARYGGDETRLELNLEADGDVRVRALMPLVLTAGGARYERLNLVARGPRGLSTLPLLVEVAPHPRVGKSSWTPPPSASGRGDGLVEAPDRFIELILERPGGSGTAAHEEHVPPSVLLRLGVDGASLQLGESEEAIRTPSQAAAVLAPHLAAYPDLEAIPVELEPDLTLQRLIAWLEAIAEEPAELGSLVPPQPLPPPVLRLSAPWDVAAD